VVLRPEIPLKFGRWQVAESRVQALLVVDLLEKIVDGRARFTQVRYSLRWTFSYFIVFMNDSHTALSQGFPLRDMLIWIWWTFSNWV
jgi:hypothetical protein